MTMDTLVAVGTTAAWAYSMVVTLWPELVGYAGIEPDVVLRQLPTIIIGLVLLGRWLEGRAKGQTTGAIRRLVALQATTARRVRDGVEEDVDLAIVEPGDLLRVRPGDKVPGGRDRRRGRVGGRRVDAHGRADARDEGRSATRSSGATVNTTGSFVMRATHVGRDTALARIVALVERAQGSKAPIQRLADRVSEVFVPLVLVVGGGHVRGLDAARAGAAVHARPDGVHRRRDHRLPVRDGPGHADRDHGRDGEGGRGGDPRPWRRGARGRRTGRRRRPRQDRHADPWSPGGVGESCRRAGFTPDRVLDLAASLERGSRAPAGRGDRAPGRESTSSVSWPSTASRRSSGGASTGSRRMALRGRGRQPPPDGTSAAWTWPRSSSLRGSRVGRRRVGRVRRRRRARPPAWSRSRTRSGPSRPTPFAGCGADRRARCGSLTGDADRDRRGRGASRRHPGRTTSIAEVLPADKDATIERLQADGHGRGDGRRRHQ